MHLAKSKKLDPKIYTLYDYAYDLLPKVKLRTEHAPGVLGVEGLGSG